MDEYLPRLSERQQRWARFLALLVVIGLLVWVATALRQVLTPLVAALALAYILNPLVTWLEETHKIKRVTSVSLGLALLLVVGASLLFVGTVQIVQLAGDIPEHTTAALEWLDQTAPGLLGTALEPGVTENPPAVSGTQQEPTSDARERLAQLATEHGISLGRSVVGYIGRVVSNAFYWLSLTVLLPLYTFFFLLNFNEIVHAARDHLPSAYRPTVVRIVTTIDAAIATFFRGRLLVCLAVGTLTGLGWLSLGLLGIHVPYNLALGALAGTLNLVPFLSVLALPPALLLTYLNATANDENWVVAVTLVFAVYLLVQAIETFVLTPVIEAKASGLHPVTTVIALLIGGQLAGLLGMLLAIPLASTLKSLGIEYLLPEVRRLAQAETDTSAAEDTS